MASDVEATANSAGDPATAVIDEHAATDESVAAAEPTVAEPVADPVAAKPRRRRKAAAEPTGTADDAAGETVAAEPVTAEPEAEVAPAPKRRRSKAAASTDGVAAVAEAPAETPGEIAVDAPAKPARASRARKSAATPVATSDDAAGDGDPALAPAAAMEPEPALAAASEVASQPDEDNGPTETGERRRGWWQRTFGA